MYFKTNQINSYGKHFQLFVRSQDKQNGHNELTETNLEQTPWSNSFRKVPQCYKLRCLRNVVAKFLNM